MSNSPTGLPLWGRRPRGVEHSRGIVELSSTGTQSAVAVALAVILGWAALSKITRRDATSAAFGQMGLPSPARLALAVPAVEAAIALGLLLIPGWAAVGAFALFISFTVYLLGLIRSGATIGCNCFGGRSQAPAHWADVVRNAGLMGMASVVVPLERLASPRLADVAVTILAVLFGAVVIAGLRRLPSGPLRLN